jgi:phage terminase large subunit
MPLVNGVVTPLSIPRKHYDVLTDKKPGVRFRALYGGRNGAKDHSFARFLVEMTVRTSKRVLFTREVQKSLEASSKQLLEDIIVELGYSEYFDVFKSDIKSKVNGSKFLFSGLNDIVAGDLKSTEGIDIAVVGEAENLTKKSFDTLNFTIREPGSEIWIAFNPRFEDDFVYKFCVEDPPENMVSCLVNGFAVASDGKTVIKADNPFVDETQIVEAQRLFNTDPDGFKNQCLGQPIGQGGRVYPMYKPDVHEIDFDLTMLPKCNLYMAIDPHRKYYPAITWYAVTPTNLVIVYNEYPKYDDLGVWYDEGRNTKPFELTPKQLANVILANDLNTQYGGFIRARVGDPHFFAEFPDFTRGLMEHEVTGWIDAPFEQIEQQRDRLKSMMIYNPALPLTAINFPDWLVHRGCKNKSRAYRRHSWDEKRDKESETHKDFIDNDRYFLSIFNGKPVFIDPPKASQQKVRSLSDMQLESLPIRNFGK